MNVNDKTGLGLSIAYRALRIAHRAIITSIKISVFFN